MTQDKDVSMTQHKNVYVALAAAQAVMGTVVKGAINPHFKSKYADLADVVSVALPALNANGIALFHQIVKVDGEPSMRTVLAHGATDTEVFCDVPLIVAGNNMQAMKSATTYAKRIGVESLTGLAPEDDDGNAAASSPPVKSSAQLKRDGAWDSLKSRLDSDMADCHSTVSLAKLRADYREQARNEGWPRNWLDALAEEFDAMEKALEQVETLGSG